MVLVTLRASVKDMDQFHQEEVKENITPSELATIARSNFDCFTKSSTNPVLIYMPSGEEFRGGTLAENQELYASQLPEEEEGDEEKVLRLCLLGSGAVGKSCIVIRFMRNIFNDYYDPTIEDSYRKHVRVDGQIVSVDILDTAGQEDFDALKAAWYRKKDGFLLIFALDNANGLEELGKFYCELSNFYEVEPVPPILIAGNKADLVSPEQSQELWLKAKEKSTEWGAVGLMRTSAKTGMNIEAAFANLVRAIRRRKMKVPVQKKRSWCNLL